MKHYFEDIEAVLKSQDTSKNGITSEQFQERLQKYGKNKLDEGKKKSIIVIFLEQLKDPMVIVLIAAAIISGAVKEIADSIIILMVVLLNAILGVVQEGKAEKAIEALQKMASPYSKVRRDGKVVQIKSEEIVPGDIVLLEAGDAVPADMRLIEASSLKIEEASLTGESVPTEKSADTIVAKDKDVPLGDRHNMAYMGTNVVYGRGEGVVINTGMQTEMGKIANILSTTGEEKTPLQKKLAGLSKVLSIAVLGICIFIFIFSVLKNGGFSGGHVLDAFLLAISLAVAAIPEGLVAVVTVVLSIGVTKMSKRNSIIRRLTAVETLGCTQIICSDKTGTLTQNKMTVVDFFGDKEKLALSMALCNDASLSEENGEVVGEPTESALVRYAFEMGLSKNKLEAEMPRCAEAPFDSVRKMMSTVHKIESGKYIQYTKGAPDELLKKCTHIYTKDGVVPITDKHRSEILAENKKMANKALRVLASAMKERNSLPSDVSPESLEQDLTFIGLVGMIDPVRPEVKAAIEKCRQAGIRPIMITGDHKDTAVAIAKELGIITDESQAITGSELSEISDGDFEKKITGIFVYARVQPEHKVRIVNTWKKLGKITAMTGDGVNDSPALKRADVGFAMGSGTEVAKEAGDIVVLDDNFLSITKAVLYGRTIFNNIRKFIVFQLTINVAAVLVAFIGPFLGLAGGLPLTMTQMLWVNLVMDTLAALAFGGEPALKRYMKERPKTRTESIVSKVMWHSILFNGIFVALASVIFLKSEYLHSLFRPSEGDIVFLTGFFSLFIFLNVFNMFNARTAKANIFDNIKGNPGFLRVALLITVVQVALVYVGGKVLRTTGLTSFEWAVVLGLAIIIIPLNILRKTLIDKPTIE